MAHPAQRWLLGLSAAAALSLTACKSYFFNQGAVYQQVQAGALDAAEARLAKLDKAEKRNNRVLYLTDRGLVAFYAGRYAEAIGYLNSADQNAEDLFRDLGSEALALAVNPNVTPYYADPSERLALNYFKALAYWRLGQMRSALVEVRRMDNVLAVIRQRYKGRENAYTQDAFAHLFMGLVYEASGEANNAFIAYRNAYNAYTSFAAKVLGTPAPEQLKKDLVRMALRAGLRSEAEQYARDFKLDVQALSAQAAQPPREAIVLANMGLAPLRTQWSLNFAVVKPRGQNFVRLSNGDINFQLDVPVQQNDSLWNGVSLLRIAMPRYAYREPAYRVGSVGGVQAVVVEDFSKIKQRILKDELWATLGKELGRVALKKASELALRKQGETTAASVLSVANAVTQQADLRSVGILPSEVAYARVPLADTATGVRLTLQPRYPAAGGVRSQWLPMPKSTEGMRLAIYQNLAAGPLLPFPDDKQYWNSLQ